MASEVPESISFPDEESKTLNMWKELDAFKKCLEQSTGKPQFTFYDGPPFATGLPHYGHILAGTIKDIVTRFAHQSGFHVERRFGWDCHGLPVEFEIDKMLDIKGPQDVEKMGIANYNAECRKIVMRYANEWENIVTRMGRWIDFENDYKTLYPWFMESVWWVFKQLFDKGMVYKGVKVMPYSTACNTPLSNFESGQNYKEVVDPAVFVSFPLLENEKVALVAWTTTPWTLPSNLAICVNANFDYVKVECKKTKAVYIMLEARLMSLFKKPEEYTILEKFKGKTLENKKYKPLFPYFEHRSKTGAFRVLCDDYVSDEGGTGVVHQAPYFGEDDYRVCLANGVITKESEIVCPIDASGVFTSKVTDFAGQYVKDADKNIVKHLKSSGRLVHQSTTKHNYPFCWRSDTPLIYRAVPSWFIRVEQIVENLMANNQQTYWVPDFVKEKRFGNWLRDARDWAVSRNRYWGTPIPLWVSDDGEEVVCVGSIKELEELSGVKVDDLHRETVDKLTIKSKKGKGILKRVSEVFDCWFESGSMPYAQQHYPFENAKQFEHRFPADFIAEGVDQTRGWFYTLLVLSTSLFNKPPFKNVVVNGIVLASDGQKMSKRKKNYPDPLEIINKYGADALRLYLINSPAVRAENLRFKEEGVRDVLKDVFLPWYNAYRFLIQNVKIFEKNFNEVFTFDPKVARKPDNLMDRWVLSFTQSLILFVKQEMKAYRLYTVVPKLVKFIDSLTNWFVRMNRKRLKGDLGLKDTRNALETLFSVLLSLVQLMAPFTPFLTELMYQNLRKLLKDGYAVDCVHYLMLPDADLSLIEEEVERRVQRMQTVVEIGRICRDRKTLPIKYPLKEVIVISKDEEILNDINSLEKYILEELNVKQLTVTSNKEKYNIRLKAEPDIKALGLRLRNESKNVIQAIRQLNDEQLQVFQKNPTSFAVCNQVLEPGEIRLSYTFGDDSTKSDNKYEADSDGDILVLLDIQPDSSMMDEGIAREVINRIQKLRKKAHLVPTDPISVYYDIENGDDLTRIIKSQKSFIINALKAPLETFPVPGNKNVIIEECQQLKGATLRMVITSMSSTPINHEKRETAQLPFVKFVNVRLFCERSTSEATVLLENPVGSNSLKFDELVKHVSI
ncbi:isoleucine--tRNA ligase: cytoplasmic-like protein [Leptotrombidium deliense]|uniref:Isoleucine--tRNA ligase, cytoplasmic n=1 Tax=Leptotrombidium deliense TaxID=299467 RepID=A0A443STU7_9ACAR|nr:isoleucine--tRNA ligase: cytoplasmic-like protein [Leptotrombidium deliense]